MSESLQGKKIVIAGSQKTREMSDIIERQGGIPVIRSLQGITPAEESVVLADAQTLLDEGADWIMFTTGIGFEMIHNAAKHLGRDREFVELLRRVRVVSRGYRTFGFLKNIGIQPTVFADDGSLRNIIEKLSPLDLSSQRIWIQLHGQHESDLLEYLQGRSPAQIRTSLPYRYEAPDESTLRTLVQELQEGAVDAVCFTTRAQIQYLFDFARKQGVEQAVKTAFETSVLPVAVGKVTAEGLYDEGLQRVIVPDTQRMGGMVVEIAHYYEALHGE